MADFVGIKVLTVAQNSYCFNLGEFLHFMAVERFNERELSFLYAAIHRQVESFGGERIRVLQSLSVVLYFVFGRKWNFERNGFIPP